MTHYDRLVALYQQYRRDRAFWRKLTRRDTKAMALISRIIADGSLRAELADPSSRVSDRRRRWITVLVDQAADRRSLSYQVASRMMPLLLGQDRYPLLFDTLLLLRSYHALTPVLLAALPDHERLPSMFKAR